MWDKCIILCLLLCTPLGRADDAIDLPWSFLPLQSQPVPEVERESWPQTRLDRFVLAGIEKQRLTPAPPASDRKLLRRLTFNLIGLAPTLGQLEAFRAAARINRPHAVRQVVNELLASPQYGERWARHWLDLARYTDKTASWLNSTADPWRYRDWVVQAFNQDLRYDTFVKKQLANDLMTGSDPADNAALGFLGLSPTYWKELQLPPEVIKTTVADEWEERMDAVGRTFLGLTLGCARCHDHKFEPIPQADYYALAGVFASIRISDRPTISEKRWTPVAAARQKVAQLEKQIETITKEKDRSKENKGAATEALRSEIEALIDRTPDYHSPTVSGVKETALYVRAADGRHGTELEYRDNESRNLALHNRGNPNSTGETIPRRFLGVFPYQDDTPRTFMQGSGRLDLAEAMVTEAAPLAARVIVNRVWLHHFGRGIVPTPSELGHSGEAPSHPALLDDLASRFIESNWSIKWLHREILQSSTWQQSGENPDAIKSDPQNQWLARMQPRRLDAEVWRDALLQAAGTLNERMGGAPELLSKPDHQRRTLYGTIHRREPNAFLRIHDFPDPTAHSPMRTATTSPLQQLFSLNSPFIQARAEELATRFQHISDFKSRIHSLYQTLFQRSPAENEHSIAQQFLAGQESDLEAWNHYTQTLLISNELLFLD